MKAERRRELYGPDICLAREAAKKLLEKDHIRPNLQSGINQQHSNQLFLTTTNDHFRHSKVTPHTKLPPTHQKTAHFTLGYDSQPQSSVTGSDYGVKPLSEFKPSRPDYLTKCNLPDFAPQYRADDKIGHSSYKSEFGSGKKAEAVEVIGSKYHRSAHFVLGNFSESPASEMQASYKGDNNNWEELSSHSDKSHSSQSNVFREGDYNDISPDPKERFTSTQMKDFPKDSGLTRKHYSHILPKHPPEHYVSTLRRLLIEKNEEEFRNPRDPTTINVVKAFGAYDQHKTGSISVEDLKSMCKKLGVPINRNEVQNLLKECNCDEAGEIDFVKFCEYLISHKDTPKTDATTTTSAVYSGNQGLSGIETEDDEEKEGFRTSTNFVLGYDKGENASVYKRDFPKNRHEPRFLASGLPCSKVMHEFPVVGTSTSVQREDFTTHKIGPGRTQDYKDIAKRIKTVSVDMNCGPPSKNPNQSEMTASFCEPGGSEHKAVPLSSLKSYRHLESNNALPHPLELQIRSEAQHNYTMPLKDESEYQLKRRENIGNMNERIQDNKKTHYVVGYDPPQLQSEQTAEFGDKKIVDRSAQPAGHLSTGFSITAHDTGEYEYSSADRDLSDTQQVLQQRNFLKNINPRDTANLNLRKAFLEYDKNLSGSISREDLKTVCKSMDIDVTDSNLDELMARCDLKGDGLIDYHEFALNLSRLQPPKMALLPGASHSPWTTTITRTDFKPPKEQQVPEKRRLVEEKDAKRFEHVEIQPSRLLQWAGDPDYLQSIQRKDYKEPDSVVIN